MSASPAIGTDLGALCPCHKGLVLWTHGYPEQALEEAMGDALAVAQDLSHPHSLAAALSLAGGLQVLRREPQRAQAHVDEAVALCDEYHFPY